MGLVRYGFDLWKPKFWNQINRLCPQFKNEIDIIFIRYFPFKYSFQIHQFTKKKFMMLNFALILEAQTKFN